MVENKLKEVLQGIVEREQSIFKRCLQQSKAYCAAFNITDKELVCAVGKVYIRVSDKYSLFPKNIACHKYGISNWLNIIYVGITDASLEQYIEHAGGGTTLITCITTNIHNEILIAIKNNKYDVFAL